MGDDLLKEDLAMLGFDLDRVNEVLDAAKKEDKLTKEEMIQAMSELGSRCPLCGTEPHQFIFHTYKQSVWCPRCGMPPVPVPNFLKKEIAK